MEPIISDLHTYENTFSSLHKCKVSWHRIRKPTWYVKWCRPSISCDYDIFYIWQNASIGASSNTLLEVLWNVAIEFKLVISQNYIHTHFCLHMLINSCYNDKTVMRLYNHYVWNSFSLKILILKRPHVDKNLRRKNMWLSSAIYSPVFILVCGAMQLRWGYGFVVTQFIYPIVFVQFSWYCNTSITTVFHGFNCVLTQVIP